MTYDLIDKLDDAIASHTPRRIPLAAQLWTVADVAECLSCSTDHHGLAFTDVACHNERMDHPLRWRCWPRRIFVNRMSDLFHQDVPNEFIDKVFAVMALAPWHTFQVLTKRPERMRDYLSDRFVTDGIEEQMIALLARHPDLEPRQKIYPLPNVWLGVSVEDQDSADARIPLLLRTPAAVRWISAEPLLGPVDLMQLDDHSRGGLTIYGWNCLYRNPTFGRPGIDWVVVGGESGPNARPMHPDWVRSLRDQCADSGVPFLFKQWGEWGADGKKRSKKKNGRMLDDVQHDGYPA